MVAASRSRGLRFEPLERRMLLDGAGMSDGPALDDFVRFDSAEQLEQYLIDDALDRYGGLFGQPASPYWGWYRGDSPDVMFTAEVAGNVNADPAEASSDHSDTNTQVEGVDEGDIVETDGDYLYVLSGQEIVIIDALPADPLPDDTLRVASRIQITGQPFEQYLNGDRLTVLSREGGDCWGSGQPVWRGGEIAMMQADVGCWPSEPVDATVTVTVLDVSDRGAPVVVQQTELDGSYVASRAIDDSVYVVLSNGFYLPRPELVAVSGDQTPTDEYVYETEEAYLARIEGQVLDLALPQYSGYGPDGELIESGLVSEATDVYRPLSAEDEHLMSVVVFDMRIDTPGPVSSTSVPMDSATEVYMSADSLYLLRSSYPAWFFTGNSDGPQERTSILKLDLDPSGQSVDLAAVGTVPGRVLNQFSVDEYGGYLRIATTKGQSGFFMAEDWAGENLSQNNIYVLGQDGEALQIVGRLEGLAAGEKIYSARFMGDRAFVVTFRTVDPLFAIDLSDPTSPQVAGELKVTGFSDYLHPVEGGYLLGMGREVSEASQYYEDPQVSLFDVNDLSDPQMLDRYTIPTGRAGGLDIFEDHHAISYFPEYGVLAVAIPAYEDMDSGSMWRWCGRVDVDMWVFRVDPRAEPGSDHIELLGRIEHDRSVLRSVRLGELLYTISEDTVSAHELLNPDVEVGSVHYGETELGTIEFVELNDFDLAAGDRRFRFQTSRAGLLALETVRGGSLEAELYDADGELLGSLAAGQGNWEVDAGETFSLRVRAAADDAELLVANVVERDGSRITIHSTVAADLLELDLTTRVVTLNGVEHSLGDGPIRSITFEDGKRTDTVVLTGTEADETAELWPGAVSFNSDDLTVTVRGVHTITVYGGGGDDSAVLHDSAGDDQLVQWAAGSMIGRGTVYSNKVHDFPTVYARSTEGGQDVGKVYDSPGNDQFLAKPGFTRLSGEGFLKQAEGFYAMHAFATAGGNDVALMYDSAGNDTFSANSIGGALFGEGFYNRAKFFEGVHAYATADGIDVAKLFDSTGDDTFYADPVQGALYGAGYYLRAKHFEGVHAYATAGGHDVARLLDSAEDDIFRSSPDSGALYRPGFYYNRAKHFEEVRAEASAGGQDRAYLHDSALGDLLEAEGNWARLSNAELDFLYEASAFEFVEAVATAAAGNRAIAPRLDFILEQVGVWVDR